MNPCKMVCCLNHEHCQIIRSLPATSTPPPRHPMKPPTIPLALAATLLSRTPTHSTPIDAMTETDSSITPVDDEPTRLRSRRSSDKKKKEKKSKRKKKLTDQYTWSDSDDGDNGSDEHDDVKPSSSRDEHDCSNSAVEVVEEKSSKKRNKKNKKEKKKKKKRKRSDGVDNASVEDDSCSGSNNSDDVRSKKKKKKSKDKHHPVAVESGDGDEKIVSSSAIEYYPEDLKHLQLKKNQDEIETDGKRVGRSKKSKLKPKKSAAAAAGEEDTTRISNTNPTDGSSSTKPKQEEASTSNDKFDTISNNKLDNITLCLFYQYVEPPWDEAQFQKALSFVTSQGDKHSITGRMRVAREGLNCTLTGSPDGIRGWCAALRSYDGGRSKIDETTGETLSTEFSETEFKLTDDLPPKQRFPKLHPFEVVELVNYGLAGSRAPPISRHGGTHLEPTDYHTKMQESDTVIIDVRNHYEANIGRFDPPVGGATMIDPKMRKSTEFPMWLDKPETKEMLRGKQVLMYCTGGVRCERASALLRQKIDTEDDTKELGIKGVYQLQGGVDKYFKQFPEGGLWKGKNYTFDKRFAHAPAALEAAERTKKVLGDHDEVEVKKVAATTVKGEEKKVEIMGKCEACLKPWDMYRGKRRCPTCGVPSLICRDCFEADKSGTKKLSREVRCDLCVTEDVRNKRELREREEREMKEYEHKLKQKLGSEEYEPPTQRKHAITRKPKPNPERITRLFLKNMSAQQMDEGKLLEFVAPARVTHIQWLKDRNTGKFYGTAFMEVKSAEDAGSVVALDGMMVLGRKIKIKYQKPDSKDVWPIPNTEVSIS